MLKRFAIIALLACACATTPLNKETIDLEPLILNQGRDGKVKVLEVRPLFKEAADDYADGRYEEAVEKFQLVISTYPKTKYASHAHFNRGLALQRLDRHPEALADFGEAERRLPAGTDKRDAQLQQITSLEKLGRWSTLLPLAETLLKGRKMPPVERIELQARVGIAHYDARRYARAERVFKDVLELYRQNAEISRLKSNVYVTRSQYLVGEIYRHLFQSIKFRLPVETMKRDLQDKSSFFLKGQSAYLRAIRLSNKRWSVAAGYKLGRLYQEMYRDMMKAEVPPELDEADRQVYFDELKTHIKPLVVRAIEIYERNLGMSDRLGGGGEWASKTLEELDKMRDVLRKDFREGH